MRGQTAPVIRFQANGLVVVQPSPPLARFINNYCFFDFYHSHTTPLQRTNFPSGTVDAWFHFADQPAIRGAHGSLAAAHIVGVAHQANQYVFAGHTKSIQVEFRPAGAAAFFRSPLHDFAAQVVPLDDFWPSWFIQSLYEMSNAPILQQTVNLETLLWSQLTQRNQPIDRVIAAVNLLRRHWGQIPIRVLADTLNVSRSQLERTFIAQLGATPKQYARTIRFLGTLLHINQQQHWHWAELALQHGYYDQAHLIHEFSTFTGTTPAAFIATRHDAAFLQENWDTYT